MFCLVSISSPCFSLLFGDDEDVHTYPKKKKIVREWRRCWWWWDDSLYWFLFLSLSLLTLVYSSRKRCTVVDRDVYYRENERERERREWKRWMFQSRLPKSLGHELTQVTFSPPDVIIVITHIDYREWLWGDPSSFRPSLWNYESRHESFLLLSDKKGYGKVQKEREGDQSLDPIQFPWIKVMFRHTRFSSSFRYITASPCFAKFNGKREMEKGKKSCLPITFVSLCR